MNNINTRYIIMVFENKYILWKIGGFDLIEKTTVNSFPAEEYCLKNGIHSKNVY